MAAEKQRQDRSLAVRQPYRDMEDWTQRWEDFFNRPFLPAMRRLLPGDAGEWSPTIDVMEKDDRYIIKAELPGVKEEDVDVSVTGDMLTISGEKEAEAEEERKGYYYSESSYGSFSRSITMPSTVDPDKIEANYDKGVLEITLPKTPETKPKRVRVIAKKKEIGKGQAKSRTSIKEEGKD